MPDRARLTLLGARLLYGRQRVGTGLISAAINASVILDVDGVSDFNALHSGKNAEVQPRAFDVLAIDGEVSAT